MMMEWNATEFIRFGAKKGASPRLAFSRLICTIFCGGRELWVRKLDMRPGSEEAEDVREIHAMRGVILMCMVCG
jgi:hypothetical protein